MVSLIKTLSNKVSRLEDDNGTLSETVETLEEAREKPFKSSEKALVITENVDKKTRTEEGVLYNNFLTPEVMKFMPSNPNPDSKI